MYEPRINKQRKVARRYEGARRGKAVLSIVNFQPDAAVAAPEAAPRHAEAVLKAEYISSEDEVGTRSLTCKVPFKIHGEILQVYTGAITEPRAGRRK